MNDNSARSALPKKYCSPNLRNIAPISWRERARSYKRELLVYCAAQSQSSHPAIKFCMFTSGRTGSTLFFDLANSHPHIQCEGHAKRTELLGAPFLWPRHYVEARARLCPASVYGFKLQLNHLTRHNPTDPHRFIRGLHGGGWKIIYLTRRNLLRRALSKYIAHETQVWHAIQNSDGEICNLEKSAAAKQKITVDIELFLQYLDQVKNSLTYTNQVMRDVPHWKLEYEDDLLTPEQQTQTMNRFFAWLGLPPHTVSTSFVRTGSDDWQERIENGEEVIAALRGTPFEKFLDVS
jgi:hypothetical protein